MERYQGGGGWWFVEVGGDDAEDVGVRDSVEAVFAKALFLSDVLSDGVGSDLCWERVVECRVEESYVLDFGETGDAGFDDGDGGTIVSWKLSVEGEEPVKGKSEIVQRS